MLFISVEYVQLNTINIIVKPPLALSIRRRSYLDEKKK